MSRLRGLVCSMLLAAVAAPRSASAAAWVSQEGELFLTVTVLGDFYDAELRDSSVSTLLDEAGGSKVETGPVQRYGLFLSGEYGLTRSLTLGASIAGMYTQHERVGANLAKWTDAQPNQLVSLQDLQLSARYNVYNTQGSSPLAISPTIALAFPLQQYDTSVHNTVGDGVPSIDLGLAISQIFQELRFFYNIDVAYRIREKAAYRVGTVFPEQVFVTNPRLAEAGFKAGGSVHDQLLVQLESGYFFTEALAIRVFGRFQDTLGGEDLTFRGMPTMQAMQIPKVSMFENAVAYNQDVLYLGGGPSFQLGDDVSISATYVHAVWFRNFPNIKTVNVSFSFRFPTPEESAPAVEAPAEDAPAQEQP
jgi:hypothetical protein